jgi:putative SOS response-associated peptidase YedK
MCGRFQASRSAAEVARWFKTTGPLPNLRARYNAAPTQHLGVVLRDKESGERRLDALRWGLIPFCQSALDWGSDSHLMEAGDVGLDSARGFTSGRRCHATRFSSFSVGAAGFRCGGDDQRRR